ncbi:peptide transporter [Sphingomonas sp. Root710]|nr:peptide transporter [Sphingomonas sp. Root710]
MRRTLFSAAAVLALFFATASNSVSAQVAPPPVANAAQLAAPTREEIDRRTQEGAPRSARLTVDGDIERAPCALDSPAYADIKVTITEAQFNNLQGVSAEELKASYASLLGADRPISTICTIRDAAATALRRKGYLAAVQVPVQRIENGVVKFEVLFAKIVAIRVRGDAGKAEGLLAGYLKHLTEEKVFNRFVAERYLLLSRDLPGYEVRLALKPAGTAPGELVGEVSVVRSPLDISANLQNFSSHSSGRWTGALAAQAYGLLGGDRLTASVSSTADFKEQQVVQLGYDARLGGEGLTWSGNFTYAWSKPDIGAVAGAGTELTARTLFATGELRYPVIRSQSFSLLGAAGLDYLNQTVELKPFVPSKLSIDHLRVAFLRLDMDAADISEQHAPMWRASGSLELRQGLDILGTDTGARGPSRADGDQTSTLIRGSASIELNMGKGMWLVATPRFQYAFDPLFSFEEISAGNYSIGRGYDPGVITGDSGIGSGFEWRLPRIVPFRNANLALLPFTFVDVLWTWNKNNPLDGGQTDGAVVSAGAGVRAQLNNRFRIDGTVAVPLRKAGLQTRNHDPRFLLSLSTKLWPWDN